jgi:D-alanyl-D-alanine carboxypeptidase
MIGHKLRLPETAADPKRVHTVLTYLRCGIAALVVVLAASAFTMSAFARAHSVTSAQGKVRLASITKSLVRDGAPGALVVLRTPTHVTRAASGLSSRDPRIPMRANARFRIASVTKPFVATVVMELVGEGKLSLDDSVERWLPGLVPNGRNITIRELMNHTSGIYNFTDDPTLARTEIADPTRIWSPRELIAVATRHPPLFAPGTGWWYSNTNYVILGLVVEAVTRTPLEQQLRARIFDPLALASTSFVPWVDTSGTLVHAFIGSGTLSDVPAGTLIDATSAINGSWSWGAGAIVSNGDDVTRFFSALMRGRILSANLLRLMKTVAPGFDYGLGLMRVQTACGVAYGHDGDLAGYRNVVYATANGKRVVDLMVNVDSTYVPWTELEGAAQVALCFSRSSPPTYRFSETSTRRRSRGGGRTASRLRSRRPRPSASRQPWVER